MTESTWNGLASFMAEVNEGIEQDADRRFEEICERDMDEYCAELARRGLV